MTSLIVKENLPGIVSTIEQIATTAQQSGLYNGIGGKEKIFMILMTAHELGIPYMQALNGGIWNIQGKVELSARIVNSMLRKAGVKIEIKRLDSRGCILRGIRANGDECTLQFLEEDASKAGVLGRDPWKKHPEDMYFARAISKLGRRLAPDILGTAYVEGEIAEENEAKAISPDQLPIVEVEQVKQVAQEEVERFVAEFNDPLFKDFFKAVCDAYSKKSIPEVIEMLSKNLDETKSKFEIWKEKQQKKAA